MFGLKQVYQNLRGAAPSLPRFRQPFFYRLVRHPLYAGFIIAFWATPEMTLGHMLFSVGMTIYILIAIPYEERDLVRSEEHTSELQSLMRISYAVFCLKKNNNTNTKESQD